MKNILFIGILIFTLFSCSNNDSDTDNPDTDNPHTSDEDVLYSIPDSLNFNEFTDKLILNIKNDGKAQIKYSITSSKSYITLPVNSGNITAGNQGEIIVNADRQSLPNEIYFSKLYVTINNKKDSIVVRVNNFKEKKTFLSTDVIDAEYSKVTDQLVYVSSNPSAVNIFTSSTGVTENIPLLYIPTCISISQDGKTAAVGHDGHITYVNLNSKSIINSFDVSCYAIDIVLGNNKWAYVFPERDQWTYIRCINMNISDNNEYLQTGNTIYAGVRGRLQPSSNYIYGANNGLSPSDIEKYNTQNGIAEYSYDSPYHGDYPMDGNLWFSEDGTRIFTKGKTVLKTSEIKSQDMLYNGRITNDSNGQIEWLDHSAVKNNLYLILSTGDYLTKRKAPFIYVHNASNLSFKNKIELEKYIVINSNSTGKYYDADPFFVFSNSKGNNLLVITKATGAGLDKEWAIEKISIE